MRGGYIKFTGLITPSTLQIVPRVSELDWHRLGSILITDLFYITILPPKKSILKVVGMLW